MDQPSNRSDEGPKKRIAWLVRILWLGLLLYLEILILVGPVFRAAREVQSLRDLEGIVALVGVLLLGVLLGVFFVLVAELLSSSGDLFAVEAQPPPKDEDGKKGEEGAAGARKGAAFPSRVTQIVGAWLIILAFLSVAGLAVLLQAPDWLQKIIGPVRDSGFEDAMVTAMAGAVGGSVATILAYLKHASEQKNFDVAYFPWYVARPILGFLLGLITFFVIKGGLLATLPDGTGADLNDLSLAGVGSLVGMFSKNAVEKLREIFHTVFSSKSEVKEEVEDDLLKRLQAGLDPETFEKAKRVIKPGESNAPGDGAQEEEEEVEESEEAGQ